MSGSFYCIDASQISEQYSQRSIANGASNINAREALRMDSLGGMPLGDYYFLHDHLGSTAVLTDRDGEEITRLVDKPWGEVDTHR